MRDSSRGMQFRVTPQCTVMKSTPSSMCVRIESRKSSSESPEGSGERTIASYTGTVPTGTREPATIIRRIALMFPPVERSMTVSAPYLTAAASFSSSSAGSAL